MMAEGASSRPAIAFALDFPSVAEARAAACEVATSIGMLKVGLELFIGEGQAAVSLARELQLPLFLDLKLHDIPETVGRAVAQVAKMGARIVTVHASGGRAMLRAAVESARRAGGALDVCAVTVLTSLDDADLSDIGWTPSGSEAEASTSAIAERLARVAWEEGVRWFVCSPLEVRRLRARLGPEAILVVPAVRPLATDDGNAAAVPGDQKRTATPAEAIEAGASWLVIGRPIRDAKDRLAMATSIAASMRAAASAETPTTVAAPKE